MNIKFTCDSATDLPKELIKKYNIIVKPFTVILGEEEKTDGVDIAPQDIFDYVDRTKALPKTITTTRTIMDFVKDKFITIQKTSKLK